MQESRRLREAMAGRGGDTTKPVLVTECEIVKGGAGRRKVPSATTHQGRAGRRKAPTLAARQGQAGRRKVPSFATHQGRVGRPRAPSATTRQR